MMTIFPQPKKIKYTGAFVNPERSFNIVRDDFKAQELEFAIAKLSLRENGIPLSFILNSEYKKEQYTLELKNDNAIITASTPHGVFDAIITLLQILKQEDLCCVIIDDEPDFENRVLMIDYSRGRIPTIETLKKTIDMISAMKYNQIQMAFDSIVFEYKGLEKYYEGRSIVSADYVAQIQNYCKKNFIQLVPNQNSFGHMNEWLGLDDFKDLAECPDGFHRTDEYNRVCLLSPGTLNPYDPRSLELVDRIYSGLLPYFDSPLIHACCDETFDLKSAEGKSGEKVKKLGINKVYTEYMNKLVKLCNKYGKRMMFWADMIMDDVDALKDMPKEAIAVIWGYEQEFPFEKYCSNVHESGLDLYVAPGTCAWGSIVGRSNNMKYNQLSAAESGKKYGAKGYLLTDWGDCGHTQFPVITYVPIAYGAGLSWGVDENKVIDKACKYLDENIFFEDGFARFVYECGNAHCLEAYKRFNQTALVTAIWNKLDDTYYLYDQTPEHFMNIVRLAQEQLSKLDGFKNCPREHIEEVKLNLEMLRTIAKVCIIKTGGEVDRDEIIAEFETENVRFKKMWLEKNTSHFSDTYINYTKRLMQEMKQ